MPLHRSLLVITALALAPMALGGCATEDWGSAFRITAASTPTSDEAKQHWDVAMAGIANKSEGQTRVGLRQLQSDARTMAMSGNDRDFMIERLQRVSMAIDANEWTLAGDELQTLRWRYGRF